MVSFLPLFLYVGWRFVVLVLYYCMVLAMAVEAAAVVDVGHGGSKFWAAEG